VPLQVVVASQQPSPNPQQFEIMNIGYAIRFCRQQKRYSIPDLAERSGVSASHISLLERGKREPSFSALEKISRGLNVPLSVLVFMGTEQSDLAGFTEDVHEKLSAAALKLLQVTHDDGPQRTLL
jgi:transcriptional regulator with XRE-family HTH domain